MQGALTLRLSTPLTMPSDPERRQKRRQQFSYTYNGIPPCLLYLIYFKVRAVSDISLKFFHILRSVEIRPSTADLYISTHSSSKGKPPHNLLNIFT